MVDIVPVSKGSLVCMSKKLQQACGHISPICLVQNVTANLHLIDPLTAQMAEISGMNYYRFPFTSICDPKQLVEYTVMDVEIIRDRKPVPGQGPVSHKHVCADIWLVKTSELGINEATIHTRTHLGHLLKPGDSVMCFDLRDTNVNNDDFDKLDLDKIPDLVVVKKHYFDKNKRKRMRNWKLKHLAEGQTDDDLEKKLV